MSQQHSPLPRRSTYAWLGAGLLAFVLYASWTPFNFRPVPLHQAVEQFTSIVGGPLSVESRSDWAANLLVMIPTSFCLLGALGVDRPRWGILGDSVLVLPVCLLVSGIAEFGQLFLPDRCCASSDLVAQALGALTGGLLWCCFGQWMTDRAREFWAPTARVGLSARILPAYVALLLAVNLVPLDLTVSPGALYRKLTSERVQLVPFAGFSAEPYGATQKVLVTAVYFVLLGLLLSGLPREPWRDRRRGGTVALAVFGFSALLFGLKLPVLSRSFDVTDVLVGGCAALAGWMIGLECRDRASFREGDSAFPGLRVGLLAVWGALVTFIAWQPFDFDPTVAQDRGGRLSLLPFADLWQGPELLTFENVVQKAAMYLPLGLLLTPWRPTPVGLFWLPGLVAALVIGAILEAGQAGLASRTPLVSDIYLQAVGALVGSILTRKMCVPTGTLEAGRLRLA